MQNEKNAKRGGEKWAKVKQSKPTENHKGRYLQRNISPYPVLTHKLMVVEGTKNYS